MALPAGIIKISTPDMDTYHLGTLFDGKAPFHVGPYVTDAGTPIPVHYWTSVWRDRKAPVTIKRSPAQIVAANLMFQFGDTGCKVGKVADYKFKGPMDSAGVTPYMATTGERPDIGLVTDPAALFMLTGNPGPMLAWAYANDSFPLHYRDETTGKPIDLLKYPKANVYENPSQGSPNFPRYPKDAKGDNIKGGDMTPQQAHFPELAYVAYLATGDLGFLENIQHNATFTIICDAAISTNTAAIIHGETRGIAWAFRNLFMAHVATKDAEARGVLPASCHPSSYWKKILDNNLAYYSKVAADPANQTFRLLAEFGRFSPWTCDYLSTALAFGVLTGHSDWAPLYLWTLGNVVKRTANDGEYPPALGVAYRLDAAPGRTWRQAFDGLVGHPEVALSQADHDRLLARTITTGKPLMGSEYLMTTRAAVVMADYLGKKKLAPVFTVYPELVQCLANVKPMFEAYGSVNARVSVVSIPAA